MSAIHCEWCGKQVDRLDPFAAGRLVRHKGKYEVWCELCVAEDAKGVPSSLRSKEGLKRKTDRRGYGHP